MLLLTIDAFEFAEKFQTPVFVMTDLDLGMNSWMADPFPYPERPMDRGKVLSAEDLNRLGGFGRYEDVDGDGIPYRTLPGTNHPKAAYFTRGSGHNARRSTPSAKTTTSITWIAWRASSKPCVSSCRRR